MDKIWNLKESLFDLKNFCYNQDLKSNNVYGKFEEKINDIILEVDSLNSFSTSDKFLVEKDIANLDIVINNLNKKYSDLNKNINDLDSQLYNLGKNYHNRFESFIKSSMNIKEKILKKYYEKKISQEELFDLIDVIYMEENGLHNYRTTGVMVETMGKNTLLKTKDKYGLYYITPTKQETSNAFPYAPLSIIEFDVIELRGLPILRIDSQSSNFFLDLIQNGVTDNSRIKVVNDEDYINLYVNGKFRARKPSNKDNRRFGFRLNENSTLNYTNFISYKI